MNIAEYAGLSKMLFLGVCFLAVQLLLWVCVVCLVGEGRRLLWGSHRSPSLLFLSLVFVNICGIAKSIAAGLFPCLPGAPQGGRGFVLPPNISLGFGQAPWTIRAWPAGLFHAWSVVCLAVCAQLHVLPHQCSSVSWTTKPSAPRLSHPLCLVSLLNSTSFSFLLRPRLLRLLVSHGEHHREDEGSAGDRTSPPTLHHKVGNGSCQNLH